MSWTPSVSPSDLHGFNVTQSYGYCNFAAVALLVYETCITFDREYRHIWKRKASAATWIFLLNRYLVIALYVINVPGTFKVSDARYVSTSRPQSYEAYSWVHPMDSCPPLARVSQVLDILPYVVWALFSSLRTYAIANRAWHIASLIFMLSMVPVWIYIFRDVHQTPMNFPPPTYCISVPDYPIDVDRYLTVVSRICLIVSDILVLSVTWVKTFGIVRLAREHGLDMSLSVTKVLLRDGSTYFTVWTILNSLHIAGTYVDSIQYLTTFTEAFTSILVSRFILNLREVANAPDPVEDVEPGSEAYWHLLEESWRVADRLRADVSTLLAPLGAPLDHTFDSAVTYDSQPTAAESTGLPSPDLKESESDARGNLIQMKSVGWIRQRVA